jgi:hypothetical protein
VLLKSVLIFLAEYFTRKTAKSGAFYPITRRSLLLGTEDPMTAGSSAKQLRLQYKSDRSSFLAKKNLENIGILTSKMRKKITTVKNTSFYVENVAEVLNSPILYKFILYNTAPLNPPEKGNFTLFSGIAL